MGEFSSWATEPICCGLGDEFAEWWWCCMPSCDKDCMVTGTWCACDIIWMLWWCCGWWWCVGNEVMAAAPRSMGSILVAIIFSYITGIICQVKRKKSKQWYKIHQDFLITLLNWGWNSNALDNYNKKSSLQFIYILNNVFKSLA